MELMPVKQENNIDTIHSVEILEKEMPRFDTKNISIYDLIGENKNLSIVQKVFNNKKINEYNDQQKNEFKNKGYLIHPMITIDGDITNDVRNTISLLPRAQYVNFIKLSQLTGLAIFDFDMLASESYENETSEVKSAIQNFKEAYEKLYNKEIFELKVLADIKYYNLIKVIDQDRLIDVDFYSGDLNSLKMTLPFIKDIYSKLENHEKRINNLSEQVSEINENQRKILKVIDDIKKELENQRKQMIEMKVAMNQMQNEISSLRSEVNNMQSVIDNLRRMNEDPIMFIKNKITGECIVGPAWGPDIENIFKITPQNTKQNIINIVNKISFVDKSNEFLKDVISESISRSAL